MLVQLLDNEDGAGFIGISIIALVATFILVTGVGMSLISNSNQNQTAISLARIVSRAAANAFEQSMQNVSDPYQYAQVNSFAVNSQVNADAVTTINTMYPQDVSNIGVSCLVGKTNTTGVDIPSVGGGAQYIQPQQLAVTCSVYYQLPQNESFSLFPQGRSHAIASAIVQFGS